jgi:hypothetical protein
MFISSCILIAFIVNVINGEHVNLIDSFLNLFDGKSIKLCIGFPSIKINGNLSFKYGFSYITYTEYNPKYSRSVKIESDFFSKTIGNETYLVQLVTDKIYMEKSRQEVSQLKIVSIPFNDVFPINQNSISLSLNYIDNSYSLVHTLYNQEVISSLKFGFENDLVGSGILFFGEIPSNLTYNNSHSFYCKVNNQSHTQWNCKLGKHITIGQYTYNNKYDTVYFDVESKSNYVPFDFMLFLNETIFKPYIEKKVCEFYSKAHSDNWKFFCNCDEIMNFPNLTIILGEFEVTLKPYELWDEIQNNCYFFYESYESVYGNNFVFQNSFIGEYNTEFDYKLQRITFYSRSQTSQKIVTTMNNQNEIKVIYLIIIILLITISIYLSCNIKYYVYN